MPAGATAEGSNMFGIDSVFRCVGPQEADSRFGVVHSGGKLIARRKAVAGCGGNITPLREFDRHGQITFAVASPESSSMNQ